MPYSTAHRSIVASGALPGGEVWSCTLRAGGTFDSTTQAMADAIGEAWRQWIIAPGSLTAIGCTLGQVLIYGVQPSGPSLGPVAAAISGARAGTITNGLPNQCAVVASLRSAQGGARNRGRIYLPCTGQIVGTTGRMGPTNVSGLLATTSALLNSINTALGVTGRLSVESTVSTEPGRAITQVRIGDVVDTQRRRRDAFAENYSTAPVTAPQ